MHVGGALLEEGWAGQFYWGLWTASSSIHFIGLANILREESLSILHRDYKLGS